MSKKSKELNGLGKEALAAKVAELRKDLIKLKAQAKTTGMKNSSQIRETKRMIARALTFANVKETKETKTQTTAAKAQSKSSSKAKGKSEEE